jgi:hypothetical protein
VIRICINVLLIDKYIELMLEDNEEERELINFLKKQRSKFDELRFAML